jgi:hypothetical protein
MGYEPDWAFHEARADWAGVVDDAPAEVLASVVLLLIRRMPAAERDSHEAGDLISRLRVAQSGKRQLALPAADVAWALRAAAALPVAWGSADAMVAAANLASWCEEPGDLDVREAAAMLLAVTDERGWPAAARTKIRKRLLPLRPQAPSGGPLDLSMFRLDDGWSRAVLARVEQRLDPDGTGNVLLQHLLAASGSKPSAKWLDRVTIPLRDEGAARLLHILLDCAATAEPVPVRFKYFTVDTQLLVSSANADLLRAACWAASRIGASWVISALDAMARRSIFGNGTTCYVDSAKVPNAAVYALGLIGSDQAIACLLELQRTVKHNGYRTQIGAAIDIAAQRAGLTASELAERIIPSAGLDGNGERQVGTARISIGAGWRIVTSWDLAADPDAEAVRLVKAAAKEARTALTAERSRLEGLLAEERSWPVADWQRLYLDHPVTGALSRGLIWSFGDVTGIPAGDGLLTGPDGPGAVPAEGTVRLWHPVHASTAQVRQWRDYLASAGSAQPFKQAFREVYLLTAAELETRVYSNRFAAHILRYNQAYALVKERGWTSNYLGPHDGGYEGRARRAFPGAGLTAVFHHFATDMGELRAELCGTDRVSFYRTADPARTAVPLDEVPELVFTEAMRDVDLFVSVTSIALDPRWADRGEDPHLAYWQEFAFGELTEMAVIRREALARVVPKLKIAAQLQLDGRYLRVRGKLNTYKIHIGSGNILIEPDDRYLCIVPGGTGRSKVMLPFEGDQVLSVILSKAVLLAADEKITDPTITSQLRGRMS